MPERWVNTTIASVDKNGHRMTWGSDTIPSRSCNSMELLWSGRQKNDERYMVVGTPVGMGLPGREYSGRENDVDHRSKGASTSTWSSRSLEDRAKIVVVITSRSDIETRFTWQRHPRQSLELTIVHLWGFIFLSVEWPETGSESHHGLSLQSL